MSGFGGTGDAQSVVAFVGERGGFLAFIGEVVLGGGELCLASFAIDGEVVKRLQGFGGNDGVGLGRRGVWRLFHRPPFFFEDRRAAAIDQDSSLLLLTARRRFRATLGAGARDASSAAAMAAASVPRETPREANPPCQAANSSAPDSPRAAASLHLRANRRT